MIVLFHGKPLLGFRVDRFLTVINQNPSASFFFLKFRIPSQFSEGGKLAFLALLSQTFVIFGSNFQGHCSWQLRQPLLCSRIVFKHWWPSLDGAGPHSQPLMLAAETINFKRASKLLQFQASHEELVSRSCPERPTPRERQTSSRERFENLRKAWS